MDSNEECSLTYYSYLLKSDIFVIDVTVKQYILHISFVIVVARVFVIDIYIYI